MKCNKHIYVAAVFSMLASLGARAQSDDDFYRGRTSGPLSPDEVAALEIAKQSRTNGDGVTGDGAGAVTFVYGASVPSIVCAVTQVCDIRLQPGELVQNLNVGDAVRWSVETASSGAPETRHIIVKPLDVGLSTSLIITTDRRAYHLRLRSHRTEFMSEVRFVYPEDSWRKFQAAAAQAAALRKEQTIAETGEYLPNLQFNYRWAGNAKRWTPVRVYSDNVKTIIELPATLTQVEAPVLMILRDGEYAVVNYRLQGRRYIVDAVFDSAVLIAGVGRKQEKVTIFKEPK